MCIRDRSQPCIPALQYGIALTVSGKCNTDDLRFFYRKLSCENQKFLTIDVYKRQPIPSFSSNSATSIGRSNQYDVVSSPVVPLVSTRDVYKRQALMCGFENGNYFSRIFKKYHSTSPSQYRNLYKNLAVTPKE